MKPISDVRVVKTTESAFIKPFSMLFKQVYFYLPIYFFFFCGREGGICMMFSKMLSFFLQGGKDIKWDLIDSHNG